MIAKRNGGLFRLAFMGLMLFFLGCAAASPRVEYYLLSSLHDSAPATAPKSQGPPLKIALRPISVPDLLDRPHIVLRTGEATVEVSEFRRWGGNLKKEIARVLVENLNFLLRDFPAIAATDDLAMAPDIVLALQVQRFDGRPGGEVSLHALWTLTRAQAAGERLVKESRILVPCETPGFEGFVQAHSRAIALLGREIAAAVRARQPGPASRGSLPPSACGARGHFP